jgi:hypothetical protein
VTSYQAQVGIDLHGDAPPFIVAPLVGDNDSMEITKTWAPPGNRGFGNTKGTAEEVALLTKYGFEEVMTATGNVYYLRGRFIIHLYASDTWFCDEAVPDFTGSTLKDFFLWFDINR